jgi:UDP-2,4-diacetamido-2,4,6-trideoxy-beta-L-altropyranose hydrolase
MRCLALGQGIKDNSGNVAFVTYCESEGLINRLKKEDFYIHKLQSPCSCEKSLQIMSEEKPDWVVLDGYHFDTQYQKAIKDAGYRLLYIDDFAHLDYYYADIILNQNYGAAKFHYNAEPYTKILAGTEYVLLRREFIDYAAFKRDIPDVGHKVLITLGGADPENNTLKVMKAVNLVTVSLEIKVVIGAGNPHNRSVSDEANNSMHKVEILQAVENMAPLMAWADSAISAGGTTIWELAFMGLPSLLCIVAANQENAVTTLAHDGVIQSAGWIKERKVEDFAEAVSQLVRTKTLRGSMVIKEKETVDGKGITRIYEEMNNIGDSYRSFAHIFRRDIDLGSTTLENFVNLSEVEKQLVLNWRNSDEIRLNMFTNHVISMEEHSQFIEKLKDDHNNFYWLVREGSTPIGVVSAQKIDTTAESCFLGIYSMSRGAGTRILRHFFNLWFSSLNMKTVLCEVLEDNINALEFYKRNGFIKTDNARLIDRNGNKKKVLEMIVDKHTYSTTYTDNAA